MIFREFPKKLLITPTNSEMEVETNDDGMLEIDVLFVSSKQIISEDGAGGENFVAVGYDSENNIHEVFLNESKIIEVEKYGKIKR